MCFGLLVLENAVHFHHQIAQVKRLGQHLRARGFLARTKRHGCESGNEHYPSSRADFGASLGQLDPVHFWHDDVGKEQIVIILFDQRNGGGAAVDRIDEVASLLECASQIGAHRVVIFGKQYADHVSLQPLNLGGAVPYADPGYESLSISGLASFDTDPIQAQLPQMAEIDQRAGAGAQCVAVRSGGEVPGANGHPAYTLTQRDTAPVPVLITVPHAGRLYPAEFVATMRSGEAASLRLEDRFIDLVAVRVAQETGAALLVAHAPRAMIDLNRAPDDIDWEMVQGGTPDRRVRFAAGRRARSGLGLVPRRLAGLGELWRRPLAEADLLARLEGIHQPYHAAAAESLDAVRDRWGSALMIDLHSMPPLGTKRGSEPAPDFVIGDRFGTACDSALSAAALDFFASAGCRVAHNRPYAGGYGLERHAAPARGIHALQVEVCRSAYLDAALREPGEGLAEVSRTLAGFVRRMAAEISAGRELAQAAE